MLNKSLIILGIIFLLFSSFALADVIMPGTVPISYCARLENTEEFPDYVFLAKVVGPMADITEEYQVLESKECIKMGYKFNTAELYAIKKADFTGTISEMDEKNLISLNADINRMTLTSVWDPRSKITESFTVYSDGDSIKLDKSVKGFLLSLATFVYIIAIVALIVMILIIRRRK